MNWKNKKLLIEFLFDRHPTEDILKKNSDWNSFIASAVSERVAALLYQKVGSLLPPKAAEFMREAYYANLKQNIVMLDRAAGILQAFNAAGIPQIPLKGVFLAGCVYRDIGLRPITDFDLLIKKENLREAFQVLEKLGYAIPKNSSVQKEITPYNNALCLKDDLPVHLHWHLINSSWPLHKYVNNIDMEQVWQAAIDCEINGIKTKTLGITDQILFLCHHAFNHFFDRLILLIDIKRTMDFYHGQYSEESLLLAGREYGMEFILRKCLAEMEKLTEMDYFSTYWLYLMNEKGLNKAKFVWRTLFPQKSVLAAMHDLSPDQITWRHYFERFFGR